MALAVTLAVAPAVALAVAPAVALAVALAVEVVLWGVVAGRALLWGRVGSSGAARCSVVSVVVL